MRHYLLIALLISSCQSSHAKIEAIDVVEATQHPAALAGTALYDTVVSTLLMLSKKPDFIKALAIAQMANTGLTIAPVGARVKQAWDAAPTKPEGVKTASLRTAGKTIAIGSMMIDLGYHGYTAPTLLKLIQHPEALATYNRMRRHIPSLAAQISLWIITAVLRGLAYKYKNSSFSSLLLTSQAITSMVARFLATSHCKKALNLFSLISVRPEDTFTPETISQLDTLEKDIFTDLVSSLPSNKLAQLKKEAKTSRTRIAQASIEHEKQQAQTLERIDKKVEAADKVFHDRKTPYEDEYQKKINRINQTYEASIAVLEGDVETYAEKARVDREKTQRLIEEEINTLVQYVLQKRDEEIERIEKKTEKAILDLQKDKENLIKRYIEQAQKDISEVTNNRTIADRILSQKEREAIDLFRSSKGDLYEKAESARKEQAEVTEQQHALKLHVIKQAWEEEIAEIEEQRKSSISALSQEHAQSVKKERERLRLIYQELTGSSLSDYELDVIMRASKN